jgi:hypothetical protein
MNAIQQRPLTIFLSLMLAVYCVVYRFMPMAMQAVFLWPFGAIALYSGARLPIWGASLLMVVMMASTDLAFFIVHQYPPSPATYVCFLLWMLLGRTLLATSHSPLRAATGGVVGYALFFLITNFGSWLEGIMPEYEPKSLETLLLCYRNGLEFIRSNPSQLYGTLVMCVGIFWIHDALAKLYSPKEVVGNFEASR